MYVDRNSTIIHTVTDPDVALDAVGGEESENNLVSVLTCKRLQDLIRDKCKVGSQHFHVECLLLYHVHLMPEQVQMYSKTDTDSRFLKVCRFASMNHETLPVFKDVMIPPAVPCFRDVHRIYIIFHEDSVSTVNTSAAICGSNRVTTQSGGKRSFTKRVSFHDKTTMGRGTEVADLAFLHSLHPCGMKPAFVITKCRLPDSSRHVIDGGGGKHRHTRRYRVSAAH
jgi:hypothetical protein